MCCALTCVAFLFADGADGAYPPVRIVSTLGRAILVDGRPFFPVMAWAPCAEDIDDLSALGIDVVMGNSCGDGDTLAGATSGRMYSVLEYSSGGGEELPGLIGYYQPDEADGHGILPAALPARDAAARAGKLVFQTLSAHFADEQDPVSAEIGKEIYPGYVEKADVLGFVLYPLAHYCGHPHIGLASVYREQRDLVRLARGKPTYQWIELNELEHLCGPDPVSAAEVRAEVWLAIAGGATGIGYFAHGWPGGLWRRIHVSSEIRAEVRRTNEAIRRFAHILLAPQVEARMIPNSPVQVGARRMRSKTWLVAVNSTYARVRTSFGAVGVRPGQAHVLGENRKLRVRRGGLTDTFEPLQVHVYELTPGLQGSGVSP